jgi:mycothiol synthase
VAQEASIEVLSQLAAREVDDVMSLFATATDHDGVSPLSEHVVLHLRYGGEGPDRHVLLRAEDGALLGYAHLDPTDAVMGAAAELVVHPEHRKLGLGRRLVEAALAQVSDGRLRLWAHGDHPAAHALAGSLGFRAVRVLWQMRRSLLAPLPPVTLPEGVRVRTFRPGQDDEEWLALNASAFADHPEQGGWTLEDLAARMREDWFDPRGFLVAEEDAPGARDQPAARMLAFHWTKVHGGETASQRSTGHDPARHAHEAIGEVYVVGVSPSAQGKGLGKAMTVAGLRWLRSAGLRQAMLYVEADNLAALSVYKSLGFTHWDTDVMFYRPPGR